MFDSKADLAGARPSGVTSRFPGDRHLGRATVADWCQAPRWVWRDYLTHVAMALSTIRAGCRTLITALPTCTARRMRACSAISWASRLASTRSAWATRVLATLPTCQRTGIQPFDYTQYYGALGGGMPMPQQWQPDFDQTFADVRRMPVSQWIIRIISGRQTAERWVRYSCPIQQGMAMRQSWLTTTGDRGAQNRLRHSGANGIMQQ